MQRPAKPSRSVRLRSSPPDRHSTGPIGARLLWVQHIHFERCTAPDNGQMAVAWPFIFRRQILRSMMRAEFKRHTLGDLAQRIADNAPDAVDEQLVPWFANRPASGEGGVRAGGRRA